MEFFFDSSKPKKKEVLYGRLAVQQRMRLAMTFLNPLRPIITESWLSQAKGNKRNAFGLALRKLMLDALAGNYPDQYIIPERVDVSTGILPVPQLAEVVLGDRELEVYFTSTDNPMSSVSDEAVLVVYGPEAGMAGRNTTVCKRGDGYIKVDLPPQLWAAPFHVYLFMSTANKKQYSKSIYVGQFTH